MGYPILDILPGQDAVASEESHQLILYLGLTFFTSFFVVLFSTPSLIKVAFLKRLFDEPGEARKLHKRMVPTIGGIIIFASVIFSFSLWFPIDTVKDYPQVMRSIADFKFILACLLILFFVGVKDDIIGTAPMKKLVAHVIVGMILVLMADIRIKSLHGLFGITENLPLYASVFLSLFTYIVVVNAFNLIDGVDGLAGGVGVIGSMAFAVSFYFGGDYVMASLSLALAGALVAFLVYNFSPAKIFMGDSGSLSIGLIMCVLAIKLIEMEPVPGKAVFINQVVNPVYVMALLAYPLIDTLRIFVYRAVRGVSPFSADRNHLHHLLIDSGYNHRQTVFFIYGAHLFMIGAAVVCSSFFSVNMSFLILGATAIALAQLPALVKARRANKDARIRPIIDEPVEAA